MAMPAPGPDQEDQQEGQEPDQGGEGGDPGGASQLVTDIHADMMKLLQMVQKAGLPPEDAQGLQSLIQGFQDYVENVLGSGGGDKQAPEQGEGAAKGQSPMEAGGNPNARPIG
jgi:hypothetical protein